MNDNSEGVRIVEEAITLEMNRLKATQSATDAIMYLRSLVGTEFDEAFEAISRRIGENFKKEKIIQYD